MAFIRTLDEANIKKLSMGNEIGALNDIKLRFYRSGRYLKANACDNAALFALLKRDVATGNVFPAIRDNELHFYYNGGCLFKFARGSFLRDANFELHGKGAELLAPYEKAKKENENKFINCVGKETERKLLSKLYRYTFEAGAYSKVVVLDIEINLRGKIGCGKKCDLALLNTETDEIMFVEGKVYSDDRVRSAVGHTPEVIEQVEIYTQAIAEQRQTIITQYGEYVRIINNLFGTTYRPPRKLIEPAKLLVYKTGGGIADNVRYTIDVINEKLGANNVMWVKDNEPTLIEIWEALDGRICK